MTHESTAWRKSSFSGASGDCVKVDGTLSKLRDSKNDDPGGMLSISGGLSPFFARVKDGRFTR